MAGDFVCSVYVLVEAFIKIISSWVLAMCCSVPNDQSDKSPPVLDKPKIEQPVAPPVTEDKKCTPSRSVPKAACDYEALIAKYTVNYFGTDKYTIYHAGQIKQESNFDCEAVSWVGARGCSQFMPKTETWAQKTICAAYGRSRPNDMQWAVPCMIAYNYFHAKRVTGETEYDLWTFILWAYNGGLGWIERDKKLAKANGANPEDADAVAPYSRRSEANRVQNRDYSVKIIKRWGPLFKNAGMTGELIKT